MSDRDLGVGSAEGDSSFWFYDGGVLAGQRLYWDDSKGRFVLSTDLEIEGTTLHFGSSESFYDAGGNLIGTDDSLVVNADITASLITGFELRANSNVFINRNGPESASFLYFYDGGSWKGQSLSWNDAADQFDLSEDLLVSGTLDATGAVSAPSLASQGNLFVNQNGPEADSFLYFYNGGSATGESLQWDDADDRFELSDTLTMSGPLHSGLPTSTADVNYNAMGGVDPASGQIDDLGDLFVDNDIEVEASLYLSNNLYMEGTSASGQDADQSIYFYNANSRGSEYIRWDDSDDLFRITDSVYLGTEGDDDEAHALIANYDITFYKDYDNDSTGEWFRWYTNGWSIEQFRIEADDEAAAKFDGTVTSNGLDYAEAYKITDPTLEAGDVVSLRLDMKEHIERSSVAYDPLVVGVVSASPGFLTGGSFDAEAQADPGLAELRTQARRIGDYEAAKAYTLELRRKAGERLRPVALAGRVPVKVDGSQRPIRAGDFLTSSSRSGHAMAMDRAGAAIGVALEDFVGERGEVLMLVKPGWYDPRGLDPAETEVQSHSGEPTEAREEAAAQVGGAQIVLVAGAAGAAELAVVSEGGIDPGEELLRLDRRGNLHLKGSLRTTTQTLAEYHPISEPVEAGDVVVVDREFPGAFRPGKRLADPAVVGVVSGAPGVVLGSRIAEITDVVPELASALEAARTSGDRASQGQVWAEMQRAFESVHAPIAMSGTVLAKVDAGYGAIQPGDLLTASPTPGHAMRAENAAPGTIVGKALQTLEVGTGRIQVLVMLR